MSEFVRFLQGLAAKGLVKPPSEPFPPELPNAQPKGDAPPSAGGGFFGGRREHGTPKAPPADPVAGVGGSIGEWFDGARDDDPPRLELGEAPDFDDPYWTRHR